MASKKRIDPTVRPIDGMTDRFAIKNEKEGMRYTWAYINDPNSGAERFAAMGWEPVLWTGNANDPRPVLGKPGEPGSEIVKTGQILMTISEEDYDAINAAGNKKIDLIEKMILDQSQGINGPNGQAVRDIYSRGAAHVRVDTSDPNYRTQRVA